MKLLLLGTLLLVTIIPSLLIPVSKITSDIQFVPSASGISLSIDFGNGTIQEFQNLEGNNVYEVTNSSTTVDADWSGDLVYVFSISGVGDRDGAYWQYWVNGVRPNIAANKYILQDQDSVEWKLSAVVTGTETTTGQEIDYSLVIGTSILGVVMVSVLVVLWLTNKEGRK